jgi:hypothetical protein
LAVDCFVFWAAVVMTLYYCFVGFDHVMYSIYSTVVVVMPVLSFPCVIVPCSIRML